jgi:hypothetical protein
MFLLGALIIALVLIITTVVMGGWFDGAGSRVRGL